MATQIIERPARVQICASCPYFQDFGEPNGRGWCQVFACRARSHHRKTGDCTQEISRLEQELRIIDVEPNTKPVGVAGDSVGKALQSTKEARAEFSQGHCHGQRDAGDRLPPMYEAAKDTYAVGTLRGTTVFLISRSLKLSKRFRGRLTITANGIGTKHGSTLAAV